ncbi:MAG: hypothetical protein ACRCYU_19490, partial [Nocardioides sp.]
MIDLATFHPLAVLNAMPSSTESGWLPAGPVRRSLGVRESDRREPMSGLDALLAVLVGIGSGALNAEAG